MSDTDVKQAISDKDLQALLQRVLGHMQRDQALEAEAVLEQILRARPEEPDALQLMGVLRRAQGRPEDAEQFYRRSLKANPGQPQVHHNLGNLLRAQGRIPEAIASQREAVRLKPNYVEAWLNLGLVLADDGDLEGAEKSMRRALHVQPNFLLAKQNLGAVLTDLGKADEAEKVLKQALASRPANPRQVAALEHNLGVALSKQNRFGEALPLFDSAQGKVPDMPHIDYNRANALQGLGRFGEAEQSYRQAIARNPLDMSAHHDLNSLLFRSGDDGQFLRSYDDALSLFPDAGGLPMAKANFLFIRNEYDKARDEYERAARIFPDHAKPHDGLGMVHARQGDFDEAIREHEIAVARAPCEGDYWRNFAETLLRAGDPKRALDALDKALAVNPFDQGALAFSSVALRKLNDSRDEMLNDYERFVKVYELEVPEGYRDIESFNRDLNAALDVFHGDKREAVDQSIRGGTQTIYDLFGRRDAEIIDRLRRQIDKAVADYIAGMADNADHPLLGRRKNAFAYSGSWSSRLHDCGYHDNHFHHRGWVSSAYYVAVPDAARDTAAKEGWLKFGEPFFDAGIKDPVRRMVQPQIGRLVLFPSYMWHGTVPFHSQQARTSVAFDAVPK